MTREELLTKPFTVAGFTVTADMIHATLPMLSEAQAFTGHDVQSRLIAGGMDWKEDTSEAANRLMQRFRKLGLVSFKHSHWWPNPSEVRALPATGEVGR